MKQVYFLTRYLLVLFLLFSVITKAQTTLAAQDFENSAADTWTPTVFPNPYAFIDDAWLEYGTFFRMSPQSSSNLWAMLDLNNPNNGLSPENTEHTLTFPNISVSGENNILLSFYFNIESFDSNDYLKVEYFFDDVSQGIEDVGATIPSGTTADWVEYKKVVPNGTSSVRLTFMAMMNTDYAAIDNITLNSNAVLAVEKEEIENFTVYPNPVNNNFFTINTLNRSNKTVQIFDILGKQVYSKELQQSNEKVYTNNLKPGIYILRVEEDNKIATRKLILQ